MNFREYNQIWADALNTGLDKSQELGIKSHEFNLYNEFVFNHYKNALAKMFSRLNSFLNLDFEELTHKYLKFTPANSWDLNDFCLGFLDFFKIEFPKIDSYFYELIEYELAEFFVFKKLSLGEKIIGGINPNHELLILNYDIAKWIKNFEEKRDISTRPEVFKNALLIARDPIYFKPVFTQLTPLALAIYQELSDGEIHNGTNLSDIILKKYALSQEQSALVNQTIQELIHTSKLIISE